MDWIRILLSRCAALIHRKELDADLNQELMAHIELATEENRERGMPEEEARTAALADAAICLDCCHRGRGRRADCLHRTYPVSFEPALWREAS